MTGKNKDNDKPDNDDDYEEEEPLTLEQQRAAKRDYN
ncbi:PfWMP3_21 [Phormidium phage Pf-WMP3]|uniref:PfWMP3_21 n=1 Tax=Phormidium phage Pf-WMP3 TaxID=2914005 RepID=A5HL35_9CAUD|nr:PfWMP3_21 [Phormidium phage Pf-WMP3]ABQ12461.1 PfWMP3_21 [Phormidium phage Pf-WMP3]